MNRTFPGTFVKILRKVAGTIFGNTFSENCFYNLRVLGSPSPGQSFGRGVSGPQATEVKMTWAELGWPLNRLSFRELPSGTAAFWHRALKSYSSIALFDVSFFAALSKPRMVRGFRLALGSSKLCNMPLGLICLDV